MKCRKDYTNRLRPNHSLNLTLCGGPILGWNEMETKIGPPQSVRLAQTFGAPRLARAEPQRERRKMEADRGKGYFSAGVRVLDYREGN
jgi:hypothetical protein